MSPQYRDEPDNPIPRLSDDSIDVESQPRDSNGKLHIQSPSATSEHLSVIPIWLQESAKTFKYRWVPLPIRKAARATARWVRGPIPPQELKIYPVFPKIQEAPVKFMDKYVPKRKHRACLLVVLIAGWFLVWSIMLKHLLADGYIKGYGKPQNTWCGASFWNDGNGCGLNGDGCRPFSSTSRVFKCRANCLDVHLLETHWVGNESVDLRGLVVGGPPTADTEGRAVYRGDSFICQAAIHAGVIKASTGGCGVVTLIGEHSGFDASRRNSVQSLGFPSTFPRNYYFPDPSTYDARCPPDSRWGIFAVTTVALVLLSLFTTSPAAFFFGTFFIMIFHVGLVSDPPNQPNFYELLSTLARGLLPASFISVLMYKYCALPLLEGLTAQVEKTILYLGFCLFACLNNYTFARLIPLERLTPHDLKTQPGAPLALAIVVTIIITIVIGQIHYIRISGNMPKYLAIYGVMGSVLIILLALPGERLRIHHYILAILFMPGTFTKVRPALAYQGLLLGLFINGVARWGFDSIIQTPAALGEGGGGQGRSWWGAGHPNVTAFVPENAANITFSWGRLPAYTGIDGVSILVNDVERWRGYVDNELFWDQTQTTLRRQRHWHDRREPEFFRFAWMKGGSTGRYSDPGIWDEDDNWHPAPK